MSTRDDSKDPYSTPAVGMPDPLGEVEWATELPLCPGCGVRANLYPEKCTRCLHGLPKVKR